jgi:hypothetical protein
VQLTQLQIIQVSQYYENAIPTLETHYQFIYTSDKANMEMHELYLHIQNLNPDCEPAGIKTYCLEFYKITKAPPTSNVWGGINISDVPLIQECTTNQETTKDIHI